MKIKQERDANRWAEKKIEYYALNPEKWKKLLIEKGKYWKN